jgi:hypothetical protein
VTEIAPCEDPMVQRRSSSYQTQLGRSLQGKKLCGCQTKHEVELRQADEAVQRCYRMLSELIKLKADMHGHFYMMDQFAKTQNGPRVTQEQKTPAATLHQALSQLEKFICDRVGKAFLKRAKKQADVNMSVQEDKKLRKSRKSRLAARNHFEGESSMTLDMSEFSKPEHSRQIESMLKDYVASMKALDELTDKLKQSQALVLDTYLANATPSFNPDTFGQHRLWMAMIHSSFLHEKIGLLNAALIPSARQSTHNSVREPMETVPNPLTHRDLNRK